MSWEQEQHLLKTRCAQGRGFSQVYLTFSESGDLQAPHLQAIFQQCRSGDKATEGMEVWAFPRERVPSHEQLIGWAEGQIRYERDNGLSFGFESSVETFLMMYSKADSTLPQVRSPSLLPLPRRRCCCCCCCCCRRTPPPFREDELTMSAAQFGLLKKIHHLGCMYRIWRMDELFCRTSDSPHVHAIPDMISAELRQIVRKALESLERDILVELDKFLKPSGIPSKARAQMWAGLWQLIFVFKGLTKTFHEAGDPIDGKSVPVYSYKSCCPRRPPFFLFFPNGRQKGVGGNQTQLTNAKQRTPTFTSAGWQPRRCWLLYCPSMGATTVRRATCRLGWTAAASRRRRCGTA
jgi:hypothetical protein